MLHKQNGIVQRNGQRKEHIATHKQNDKVQQTNKMIQYNRQTKFLQLCDPHYA